MQMAKTSGVRNSDKRIRSELIRATECVRYIGQNTQLTEWFGFGHSFGNGPNVVHTARTYQSFIILYATGFWLLPIYYSYILHTLSL